MDLLWAPWRMTYINKSEQAGCIFCEKPLLDPRDSHLLIARRHGFIMLNAFPYNTGHLLIAPRKHTAELGELSAEEHVELMELLAHGIDILRKASNPDGFNIGMNLGRVAGAGIADHLHWHVVPRWAGDTNFMPVVGDTKVLPEALDACWRKLKATADELGVD